MKFHLCFISGSYNDSEVELDTMEDLKIFSEVYSNRPLVIVFNDDCLDNEPTITVW